MPAPCANLAEPASETPRRRTTDARIDADFVARLTPYVIGTAARLGRRRPPHLDNDDLIAAGWLAAVELAVAHPELERDALFSLVSARLRYAMLDALRAGDPLSRRQRMRIRRVERGRREAEHRLGRAATAAEVAQAAKLPVAAVEAAIALAVATTIEPWDEAASIEAANDADACPEHAASQRERARAVEAGLRSLPERLARVVDGYYAGEKTLKQLGAELGVTEARACQLLGDAHARLRESTKRMATQALGGTLVPLAS
jgi:RNA polymerase sigma factor for flagellar operon FliA